MELEFTAEQEELRASVRSFLQKECPIDSVRAVVETGEAPEKLWGSMVALDWPALAVPEEYGGIGLSILETAVVVEELGRAVAPGPLLATVTQFAPVVREVGTPEQQQHYLSGVATGAVTGALALADHPRAWELGDVSMTAEPSEGGWTLTGQKFAVTAAEGTTDVVVIARAGDGMGAFVVPVADAGLTPVHSLDSSRPLVTLTFDQLFVPHEHALGTPGNPEATAGIVRAIEEATVGLALETVGACDALFQLLLAYLKERQQFGVVIGSFQALKHKMSNMYLAIERARALCYLAAASINEDTAGRASAVAMAKAASDECQTLVGRESIQSFGGIGYTWEHDAHLYVKRATSDGALFGGASVHLLAVAAGMGVTSS